MKKPSRRTLVKPENKPTKPPKRDKRPGGKKKPEMMLPTNPPKYPGRGGKRRAR